MSCKDQDETFKEYVKPGGITYVQVPQQIKARPGKNKIVLSWLRGTDPNAEKAKIWWNNKADSLTYSIPANLSANDVIQVVIDNLEEREYTFIVKTYDGKGNTSIPKEVSARSYGSIYEAGVLQRLIILSEVDPASGNLRIDWGNPDLTNGAYKQELIYTNVRNQEKLLYVRLDTNVTNIQDYKTGTSFKYRTLFLPDTTAIDTVYTPFAEVSSIIAKINKSTIIATASTFQDANSRPSMLLDDNVNTHWHSQHTPSTFNRYPHWIAFDFQRLSTVKRIELTSRPEGTAVNEDFTEFTVQVSANGTTWTDVASFAMPNTRGPQPFELPNGTTTRYLRVWLSKGPHGHTHLAEFTAYGY